MKWQKSIGLLLAGLGLAVFALWFTQVNVGTPSPKPAAKGGPTNRIGTVTGGTNRAALPQGGAATNRTVGTPGIRPPGPLTNALASRSGANAPGAKAGAKGGIVPPALVAKFNQLRAHPAFYPIAAAVPLGLGILFLYLASRTKKSAGGEGLASAGAVTTTALKARPSKRGRRAAAVNQCNVLQAGPETKKVWQFSVRNGRFALAREQAAGAAEPVPGKLVAKDWHSLVKPKLNVAWLPADQVFLRVIHLPQAELEETLSMIEFQLEKLSPMPVAQIVWTMHVLPHAKPGFQTVVVTMVSRAAVEDFLGKLEADGFLADRLEIAVLDQLQATDAQVNGAWIYPGALGGHNTALVAWFYDGVLQNLDTTTPATDDRAGSVKEQLLQMAWAGELEGWLKSPPTWHLVADETTAAEWEPILKAGLEQDIEIIPPLPAAELAAETASRAAHSDPRTGLLPAEFAARYQQQFVDRLWMRALGAVVLLYLVGVGIYMTAVQVAAFRTRAVEREVAALAPTYTNAMQFKAQYQVLKDRQELKYAALDCWKSVAELLPDNITFEGISFTDGKRLVLQGTAPMGQVQQIYQFEGAMRKVAINGSSLFDPTKGESLSYHTSPGGASLSWSFALELKRSEVQ